MLRTATGLHHQKLQQVPVCSDRMSSSSESDELEVEVVEGQQGEVVVVGGLLLM